MTEMEARPADCGYKCGSLPRCAPLALSYVPDQRPAEPRYESRKALARGTLFPGLDLPLGNIVNQDVPDVPMAELMALDFAAHDLSLYLDTHPGDTEAFELYKKLLALAKEGSQRYVERYGPICKKDLANSDSFRWLQGPWPWELPGERRA